VFTQRINQEHHMKVVATSRTEQGSSASRRLRRAGQVPGIVYGGKGEPAQFQVEHNPLYHALRVEAFHSSILELEIDGKSQQVLLRDVQWHAYKPLVQHIDFQRVSADQKIHMKVPLHFHGQENSPAVKGSGGIVSHVVTDLNIACLPADLPNFIEVDLSTLEAGKALHVSNLVLPKGVTALTGKREDPVIVTVAIPAAAEETAPAAGAAAAPAAADKKGDKK
jgi:large subunit ribosomal protein L25